MNIDFMFGFFLGAVFVLIAWSVEKLLKNQAKKE
jgi:hypothetical protein